MKSNVCKIENVTRDLPAILRESEKVAEYNGFTHKQSLQLRLLCEEIAGMLPNMVDEFDGKFFIEYSDGECKINVSVKIPEFNTEKKSELIGFSKNKNNAAAVGIVGKIRSSIENFFLSEDNRAVFDHSFGAYYLSTGYGDGADYSYMWSLEQYKGSVRKEEKGEAWDELEKSVIASVADDVIVGVRGKRADITVIKKFS